MKQSVFCLLFLISQTVSVWAEIYKSVDADGHVTYSSTPSKGAKKLDLEPIPTIPASGGNASTTAPRPRSNASPADFPKVDNTTQKNRDHTRRKILDDEFSSEDKLLAEARQSLKEAEAHPEVTKTQDGKMHNAAKYEEKLKNLREEINTHEKNLASLKSEITNLK